MNKSRGNQMGISNKLTIGAALKASPFFVPGSSLRRLNIPSPALFLLHTQHSTIKSFKKLITRFSEHRDKTMIRSIVSGFISFIGVYSSLTFNLKLDLTKRWCERKQLTNGITKAYSVCPSGFYHPDRIISISVLKGIAKA